MRVLLGFGDPELGEPERGEIRAEAVVHRLRRKSDGQVRELFAVAREAHEGREARHTAPRKVGERGVGQRSGQLPRAIGAEIHEDDRVAVLDRRRARAGRDDGCGADEFVILAAGVGRREPVRGAFGRVRRAAIDEEVVRLGEPIPALVAVHRVVAADDRRDARVLVPRAHRLEQRERRRGALRRRVASVEECMHADARRASRRGELDHRRDLPLVAVHAARRHEAQHVRAWRRRPWPPRRRGSAWDCARTRPFRSHDRSACSPGRRRGRRRC